MKHAKKIMSFLLALAMVFAMAAPVWAGNTTPHTITIKHSNSAHTYTAYQVFKGDISDNKLTNIEWGSGISDAANLLNELKAIESSPYANCVSAQDVADILAGFSNNSEQVDVFAKIVNRHLSLDNQSSDAPIPEGNIYKYGIDVTGDGYYLVKDTGKISGEDVATKYILEVVKDVVVEAKAEVPTIDKVIVDADSSSGKGTAQDVGSIVSFKLTTKVPEMDSYDTYKYVVNDTMSAGLTGVDKDGNGKIDVTVTIGGKDYTDFTIEQNGQSFKIEFADLISQKANKGQEIVIQYAATINDEALKTDKETNTVYLEYSNNPSDTQSNGSTPDKTVYVYDFDIVIDKYTGDEDTGKRLSGAHFVLYKKESGQNLYYYYDNTEKKIVWKPIDANETVESAVNNGKITEVITNGEGAAEFKGLDTGVYYLQETMAPEGYNLMKEDVRVEITANYASDGQISSSSATSESEGQYQQTQKVENNSGSELPSTGGTGTTMFYIIGGILVVGALVLLIAKRRMKSEE